MTLCSVGKCPIDLKKDLCCKDCKSMLRCSNACEKSDKCTWAIKIKQ